MLMRTDPFRELDRLSQQFMAATGTWSRPSTMPLDAYRTGDCYVMVFDLPGVDSKARRIRVAGGAERGGGTPDLRQSEVAATSGDLSYSGGCADKAR